jgi:hypothetical protein
MLMIGLSMVRCACGAPGGAHADPDRGFDSDLREAGLTDAGLASEEHERASTPRCHLDGRPLPRELCVRTDGGRHLRHVVHVWQRTHTRERLIVAEVSARP